jgi:hypothetical membrane protein
MITVTNTAAPAEAADQGTRALLTCGAVAGPLFLGVAAAQVALRAGFDLTRHPLSLLSLGDLGWIQSANFVLAGILSLAAAVGIRRTLRPARGGAWGPRLVGVYGVGLVVAGIFTADPSMGFPAGAPAGNPETLSWHAVLHGVGAMLAFPSLILASFVLARTFGALGRPGWAAYSVATGVVTLAVTFWPGQDGISLRLAVGAALTFGWLSAVTARLAAPAPGRVGSASAAERVSRPA